MAEKVSALHAIYVIDGVPEEYTPAQLLDAVTEPEGRRPQAGPAEGRVVDETLDPVMADGHFPRGRPAAGRHLAVE